MPKTQARQSAIESQLRASEERYQAFIHNSQEGIWRFEVDEPIPVALSAKQQIALMYKHAYLAEANEAMAGMYGLESSKDIVGARLGDFLIEGDPQNVAYLTAFILSGYNLTNAESHEVDAAGKEKYFSNSLVGIVEDGYLVRAWGTQSDVTDQYKFATALKKSEERLALALEASETGIWEWNVKTGELMWSDRLKEIFGLLPTDEITFEKYLTLLHPEDRPKLQKTIKVAQKKGSSYKIEHRIVWPDGSVHWALGQGKAYLEDGKPVRLAGTTVLIDGSKQAELELMESEQRFRTMADAAPVFIWMSDTTKLCTYFNKGWLDFTGRTLDEEVGNGWARGVHPEDLSKCLEIYNDSFDARETFCMEYRLRRADGEYRWILDNGRPRYSPEGDFLGYVGSCTDIDDLKRTYRQKARLEITNANLKKQRTQLIALNNAKDEFISIASHQLRTPASSIKQYLGMLREGYAGKLADHQTAMLETAYESNERQIKIINDLLRVAQVDAGKVHLIRTETDLSKLVKDVIKDMRDTFKDRKQTVTFMPKGKLYASLDNRLFRMVVENLLDNASKYSAEGKPVVVTLDADEHAIVLDITDKGVGIDEKDFDKLFGKFSRINNSLSPTIEGSGLGLYWVKKIVELHGGIIDVTSVTGQGTTFSVTIPLK